jgi:hypothetical protein
MNVAVGRLQVSVNRIPVQRVAPPVRADEEIDLERAYEIDRRHQALAAERERQALRYTALGSPRY